ncbi:phospholipase-like protein, partial [Tanacetum coccineum]
FIVILLGFPGPSDGLRLHPIVFFSSGSGLTADSSVLTLTLADLPIHIIDSLEWTGRIPSLIDHISKWTNVLNVLLEKAGHFERTGRRPNNFELLYNQGLDFESPQQGNCLDCGVVTFWVIENLCRGQAPLLYNVDPVTFFSAIRVDLALRLYDCRCEDTTECGYD